MIGGGLPLAAVGGPAALMDHLAPLGDVYQAGTLSGNPLATAAGLAVLAELTDDVYATLEAAGDALADGLRRRARGAGPRGARAARRSRSPGCSSRPSRCATTTTPSAADTATYARFFHAMLDRGVFLAPSAYEAMFPSLAHTDADLERTVELAAGRSRPALG